MCILTNCKFNGKYQYGGNCCKHRRNYLVNNGIIKYETFTNKASDYLKYDIIKTIEKNHNINYKGIRTIKKQDTFILLCKMFQSFNIYDEKDTDKIISLQKLYRNRQRKYLNKLRGEGFFNKKRCHNEVDFFTYETYVEINDRYFFSYKDENDFLWFFDIRSFIKLIEMKQPNPYTMMPISNDIIKQAHDLIGKLKLCKKDEIDNQNDVIISRKQMIKQKATDLCSEISLCGYDCQPGWILSLNIRMLKKLYRNMEDIWNYRIQGLTQEMKSRICPPNGLVYNIPVHEVNGMSSILSVQEIILNETMKFNNSQNIEDRKLGYMYFLIGLGPISNECYTSHPWLGWM